MLFGGFSFSCKINLVSSTEVTIPLWNVKELVSASIPGVPSGKSREHPGDWLGPSIGNCSVSRSYLLLQKSIT